MKTRPCSRSLSRSRGHRARRRSRGGRAYFRAGAKAYSRAELRRRGDRLRRGVQGAAAARDRVLGGAGVSPAVSGRSEARVRQARGRALPRYLDKVKTGGRVGDAADNLADMQHELDKLEARGREVRRRPTARTRGSASASRSRGDDDRRAARDRRRAPATPTRGLHATHRRQAGRAVRARRCRCQGAHVIAVAADGYFPVEKKTDGGRRPVDARRARAAGPSRRSVAVATEDGAAHHRRWPRVATAPAPRSSSRPASTSSRSSHRGREPFARELVVTRGQELTLPAPLEKTARRKAVPWVLGGAGVLARAR